MAPPQKSMASARVVLPQVAWPIRAKFLMSAGRVPFMVGGLLGLEPARPSGSRRYHGFGLGLKTIHPGPTVKPHHCTWIGGVCAPVGAGGQMTGYTGQGRAAMRSMIRWAAIS